MSLTNQRNEDQLNSEFLLLCAAIELKQHYDEQVKDMVGTHQRELTQIQDNHKVEVNRMQKVLDVVKFYLLYFALHVHCIQPHNVQ